MTEVKLERGKPSFPEINVVPNSKLDSSINNFDISFARFEESIKGYTAELEKNRYELKLLKDQNKKMKASIDECIQENKTMSSKINSTRVKLGVSTAAAEASKNEMDELKSNNHEAQVEIARLEERLSAATTDLDRMRDPANPDSNSSMKRHLVVDKKEIKRLKAEIEAVQTQRDNDMGTIQHKNVEIQKLEERLRLIKGELREANEALVEAQDRAEAEKDQKQDLHNKYLRLTEDRLRYGEKLKTVKIRLGVNESARSVSEKVTQDMKLSTSQLNQRALMLERQHRENFARLELLKSKDMHTKTANSIKDHTFRLQGQTKTVDMTGRVGNLAKLQGSRLKPLKGFGSLPSVRPKNTEPSLSSRSTASETKAVRIAAQEKKAVETKKGEARRKSMSVLKTRNSVSNGKPEKNVQLVPPRKAKAV